MRSRLLFALLFRLADDISRRRLQIALWMLMLSWRDQARLLDVIDDIYFSFLFLAAAGGFVLFGGRLYYMLSGMPSSMQLSAVRRSKIKEVLMLP